MECRQFNCIQINNNNLLDLCFSNLEIILEPTQPIVTMDLYHPDLSISVELQPNLKPATLPFYNFKNADYVNLNRILLEHRLVESIFIIRTGQ